MMVVKPKWAFMIPVQEFSTFYPLTDFIVVPGWDTRALDYFTLVNIQKDKVLLMQDASGRTPVIPFHYVAKADVVVLNDNIVPVENLKGQSLVSRFLRQNCSEGTHLVGVWHGEKHHLKSLDLLVDTIALPRTENRIALKPDPGHWFLGYKNYDEVLRLKPDVVITGSPFTAAKRGDLLQTRVRRPKNLPDLNFNMVLKKREAEIALQNIKFLKSLSWEA